MMKKTAIVLILLLACISACLLAACSGGSIVGVSVHSEPDKTTYILGEELEIEGFKLSVNYANGKSTVISVTEDMINGFDTSSIGTRTITITYSKSGRSYSTTQEIRTIGIKASSLTLVTPPAKTNYVVGQLISLEGISVDVVYNNGSTATVGANSLLHEPLLAFMGQSSVTVRLDNATAVFNVTVAQKAVASLSAISPPTKSTYFAGELFEEAGLILGVVFNDGSSQQLTEGFEVVDRNILNDTTAITVRFQNFTLNVPITVNKATATGYSIVKSPKNKYTVGETVNFNGLEISVSFNNGNSITIAYDNNGIYQVNWDLVDIVWPVGALIIEDNAIALRLRYGDGENEYIMINIPIQVSLPFVTGLVVIRNQNLKTEYTAGEAISLYGLEIEAEYSNGARVTIIDNEALDPDVQYEVEALEGMESVTIRYMAFEYQYSITVNAE